MIKLKHIRPWAPRVPETTRRVRRILIPTLLALVALTLVLSTGAFAAPDTWVTVQLTSDSSDNSQPQVSGDRIVWYGQGGTDGGTDEEIFTWTPTGGTVQLTANSTDDINPQVSGDRIVWHGQSGPDGATSEIFTWTPAGGTVQLTTNSADDINPQVSGDRVVWEGWGGTDGGGDTEIFTWTPTGGIVQLTTSSIYEYSPRVSGDRIVWYGQGGTNDGEGTEIFTWTPTGGTVQLTTNGTYEWGPAVSGDRVAWYAGSSVFDPTDQEVFTWTPTGGIVQLSANSFGNSSSQVSGDRIVWYGRGGTDDGTDQEIFTWTPTGGTVQLTTNSIEDNQPQVSGDRIVWHGQHVTDQEIFTAVPAGAPPFTDIPASHSYYEAITDLANRGVVHGYDDGSFRPDNDLTRQQFAKMIVLALGYSVSDADVCPFTDVQKSLPGGYVDATDTNYPDHYVAVCAAHGITRGKTADTFAPYQNISCQQLITMVARAANLSDPPLDFAPTFSPAQFSSEEHYLEARKASYAGLLDGLQGVGPGYGFMSPATRGEACVLLHNLVASK